MRQKWIFRLLAALVFGSLFTAGLLFYKSDAGKFWILEVIAALALVFFVILYRRLVRPYEIIRSGLELLREQDFSTRLRKVGNSEADGIIDIFNRMITRLKEERLRVRETNQLLDLLINASPQGVVMLDLDGRITSLNPAACRLLHVTSPQQVEGLKIADAGLLLSRELDSLGEGENTVVRSADNSIYRCTRSSFVDRGFRHSFLLVEELTAEMRQMEKQSYESVIRMMSHEVNNSVAAIGATLNVVSDILQQDGERDWEGVQGAVDASVARCGNLARFTSNLSDVVRIPEPLFSETCLNEMAGSAVRLASAECMRRDIKLDFHPGEGQCTVPADTAQMEQVLLNIIKNACEAIGRGGNITVATSAGPPAVTVTDDGPGIDPGKAPMLFTPFFSTKPDGQGLGLMFVREVLTGHGCRFSLESAGGSTVFTIIFRDYIDGKTKSEISADFKSAAP